MPIETKKIDEKRSRNGAMSATIWWLYSLSETIRPARNAPSASENPSECVNHAMARQSDQRAQHEHLAAAQRDHAAEQARHGEARQEQHGADDHERAAETDREALSRRRHRPGQHRHQHDDGNDEEILEEENAEAHLALRRAELASRLEAA